MIPLAVENIALACGNYCTSNHLKELFKKTVSASQGLCNTSLCSLCSEDGYSQVHTRVYIYIYVVTAIRSYVIISLILQNLYDYCVVVLLTVYCLCVMASLCHSPPNIDIVRLRHLLSLCHGGNVSLTTPQCTLAVRH